MTTLNFILFVAGLALLVGGAEILVRGASRLAVTFGISPLVIGLTVVAYGTSAPELAVSVQAALAGQAGLSLGNVIGSNIFNVLFILGISAMVVPLVVAQQLIRFEVPLLIGVSAVVLLMAWDGRISRPEGGVLVAGAVMYTAWAILQSRRESASVRKEYEEGFHLDVVSKRKGSTLLNVGLVLGGLVLLVLGSRWLVRSSVDFAEALGVSEVVIGLTLVAIGTSLPELATSVVASLRGERDIAVGNVIGSNLFNLLAVMGASGILAKGGLSVSPLVVRVDLPVMLGVAVACAPVFFTGSRITRWEGGLFLTGWIAYTLYLILQAGQSASAAILGNVLLTVALPLAGLLLGSSIILDIRRGR